MNNILGIVADQENHFVPSNPQEYLALQVARKLGETTAFRHYAVLFEHYPEEILMKAFRQCCRAGEPSGRAFMFALQELTTQST